MNRQFPTRNHWSLNPTSLGIFLAQLGLLLLACPASLQAEEPEPIYERFKISTGIDLSKGDYGLSESTKDLYVPFSFSYERGNWLGKITVPLLGVRGPGDPQDLNRSDQASGKTRTASDFGIGDVNLYLSYYYWADDSEWIPHIEFGGRLKIPTASVKKNLGTGEIDTTFSLDFSRSFGDWTPFVRVAYRILGDSSDFTRHDGFGLSLGVQYDLLEKVNVGIGYDWRQSSNPSKVDPQEISPYLSYRVNDHLSVTPYTAFGLNSSSLDFGGGLTMSYRF